MHLDDAAFIEGRSQQSLALTATGAQTAAVATNKDTKFDIWHNASVPVYIKVGSAPADVTAATGYVIMPGNVVSVFVNGGRFLGGVTASGVGTLFFHETG